MAVISDQNYRHIAKMTHTLNQDDRYKHGLFQNADFKMADFKMADFKMADFKTANFKMDVIQNFIVDIKVLRILIRKDRYFLP